MKNIVENRLELQLSLRKTKVNSFISERRWAGKDSNFEENEKFEIVVSDLILPSDFDENFRSSDNMLNLALSYLRNTDTNIRQFGIRQVRNYSMTVNKNTKCDEDINLSNWEDLFTIILTSSNLKEIYEISFILLNISFVSSSLLSFLTNSSYFKKLFDLLIEIEEYTIKNHILLILGNCLSESEAIHQKIISSTTIIGYVIELLKGKGLGLPRFFRNNLIWLVGNLYKYPSELVVSSLREEVIPEVVKALSQTVDKELFSEACSTMVRIARENDEATHFIIRQSQIHILLTSYVGSQMSADELDLVFQILGNLAFIDDAYIDDMLNHNLLSLSEVYMQSLLEKFNNPNFPDFFKKNKSAVNNFCWMITNVSCNDKPSVRTRIVKKTKLPSLLLNLATMTSDKNLLKEILNFFEALLDNESQIVKTELLRIGVFDFLCSKLMTNDFATQQKSLSSLEVFLEYGTTVMKDRNIIQEAMRFNGADVTLENLANVQDRNVSELAVELLQKYFHNS